MKITHSLTCLFLLIMYLCELMCTCMGGSQMQEHLDPLELELQSVLSRLTWVLELNKGPKVFLVTKLSFKTSSAFFKKNIL